jgi:dihydrofolate synthase / folylpolyglutamate synthase
MRELFSEIWPRLDSLVRFGIKPGLERMHAALRHFKHPERSYKCILITGTNGKGSTAYCFEQLLRARGQRTGLYTSPHLSHPGERLAVNGRPFDSTLDTQMQGHLQAAWRELEGEIEPFELSYFEALTLLALLVFRQAGVQWALLECGMGGLYDACNAVRPELSVLTQVGEDHLEWLGGSLEAAARNKAGIARLGVSLLSAHHWSGQHEYLEPILREEVQMRGGHFLRAKRAKPSPEWTPVCPPDFLEQAQSLAQQGLLLLQVEGKLDAVREALPSPALQAPFENWQGRFQILGEKPPLILDVAHNSPALKGLCAELKRRWPKEKFQILFTGMASKNLTENLKALAPCAQTLHPVVFDGHPRAASSADLHLACKEAGLTSAADVDPRESRSLAERLHERGQPVLVTGSFLTVSAFLSGSLKGVFDPPPGL